MCQEVFPLKQTEVGSLALSPGLVLLVSFGQGPQVNLLQRLALVAKVPGFGYGGDTCCRVFCDSGWLGRPETCLIKEGVVSLCQFTLHFLPSSLGLECQR